MRLVVIRVSRASITIDGQSGGAMGKGLLALLGIRQGDTMEDAEYLAKKVLGLRVFEDGAGKMNLALDDVEGAIMAVSNFTLYADCARGRRPDFFHAAKPDVAVPLYEHFIHCLRLSPVPVITGEFGAEMQIDHVNDGPVTLIMDTEQMLKKKN